MLMKCAKITLCVATVATLSIITVPSFAAPVDFTAAGANPAGIQGTVDAFRNALGALNAFDGNNNADGRREINWDAQCLPRRFLQHELRPPCSRHQPQHAG